MSTMAECLLGAIGPLARSSWPLVWVTSHSFAWADGVEQPPGALERTSSCTATRTGVAGLGTARRDRRDVPHRAALRPDRT